MANDYYVISGDSLRDIADSIREKGGTSAQLEFPNGWKNAIDDIETGGGSSAGAGDVWQDANGLVHLASEASGGDDVPDDGKTRIWIHIAEGTPDNRLTFYLRFTASTANNTTVDWGDGTTQTLGSTTATNYSHKYAQGGDYVITMTVNSGTISFEGDNNNSIFGNDSNGTTNNCGRTRIKKIIFGNKTTNIGDYICKNCYTLQSVVISDSVTNIGRNVFSNCYSLTSVVFSKNLNIIKDNDFNNCYALKSITNLDNVTTINLNAFQYCYGLTSMIIPDGVTSIGTYAFHYCLNMSEYHFKPTTPPSLAATNVFTNIPSDCIIYVPQGSLSAYQSATNYGNVASQMQEEPQS